MSGYEWREARDDEHRDRLRMILTPPAREVGQKVFWTDMTGGTVYEGRITRIEIGTLGYKDEDATRKYYARAERYCYMDYRGTPTWNKEAKTTGSLHYESETHRGGDRDWWWKLFGTLDEALEKAAKERDRWAKDAERDMNNRLRDAATWRSMKTTNEEKAA